MAVFRDDLKCEVTGLSYDFEERRGILRMPQYNACDMMGCISLFAAIDPDVERIDTFAGDKKDTCYRRRTNKEAWEAFRN